MTVKTTEHIIIHDVNWLIQPDSKRSDYQYAQSDVEGLMTQSGIKVCSRLWNSCGENSLHATKWFLWGDYYETCLISLKICPHFNRKLESASDDEIIFLISLTRSMIYSHLFIVVPRRTNGIIEKPKPSCTHNNATFHLSLFSHHSYSHRHTHFYRTKPGKAAALATTSPLWFRDAKIPGKLWWS